MKPTHRLVVNKFFICRVDPLSAFGKLSCLFMLSNTLCHCSATSLIRAPFNTRLMLIVAFFFTNLSFLCVKMIASYNLEVRFIARGTCRIEAYFNQTIR